ncbi:C4-dicarboxylate ABC transporter substrate-binding protein [Vineibacter terrae]|uniref:C4-dicarboxylate ABC transporter substrate-binding protein n=1 Tax=Vineibacter terrae TaxID=2586908 RepID=A0A5C8PQ18_9HYPH|nr:TRAP transporter substrate-binding protein DctP [Vineibacter terrae]TXL76662.1 C4-dicarboxylate ABC transporter substrate-binding protein [Vineibacter terrae]
MTHPLRVAAVGAALLFASLSSAAAQTVEGPKVNWKLATWGKPRAVTAGIETLARHVKERTGGKFTIAIGYESFGGPKELLDILSVGGLDMTMICSSYHPDKQPAYTGLDLPFLPLPDFETQWKVHDAYHKHPYIQQEMGKWNAMFYVSSLLPQYEFVGRGKPPKTLADFKGMRVRAIGGIGEAMRNLGAVPTSVDATEVYTSLERGAVDAVSFPSTYAHGSYKTYEISKWFTVNMAPGTQACPVLINKDAWAKLPDAYKPLFDEVRPQIKDNLIKAYGESDAKYVPLFKQKGLEFITYSEKDLETFRQVGGRPVWDKWVKEMAAKGIPAQELLDLILKTATDAGKKT